MYCKNCGFQMADDHLVCQQCGTRKGEGSAFCDQCGTVVNIGSAFCTQCGKRIQIPVAASNNQQFTPNQFNPNPSNQQFNQIPYSQQTPAQQFRSQAQQPNSQYLPPKKYCRNCGSEVLNSQAICTKCGVKVGEGTSFCPHCAAATQPGAENCTQCGKSLKSAFDIGKYFSQFGDNIAAVFKTPDKKTMIFENFINFAAVLIFIVMFFPIVSITVSLWGYSQTESLNAFGTSGFAGFLLLLSLLTAVMKYEPFSIKFMQNQPQLSKYYIFITPALELLSLIILLISFFNGQVAAAGTYGVASVYFTFFGWLLILLILASVADAIYLFVTKNKSSI